jgi:hypothetical protein
MKAPDELVMEPRLASLVDADDLCLSILSRCRSLITAAVNRLSAAADNFHYTERCDANGNPIGTGKPNCVDLGHFAVHQWPRS